jgi:ABC-type sugar transport system ATPase subunit
MALLEVEDVSKHFPGVQALTEVSLTVKAGEVHALVGQNGAGKSTLVKCISGVHPPDSGQIIFDEEVIRTYTPKNAQDLGITVVYQRMQLLPWLSVAENILLGQMPTTAGAIIDRREANRVARELLARFKLHIDPEIPVARLSPPERQEVAIAKALYRRAKLLILDEPTAALDATLIERLFDLIGELNAEGVAVLYISHHLEEVFRLADRITVLRDGRVVTTQSAAELSQTQVVTLMAGRRIDVAVDVDEATAKPEEELQRAPPLLKFRHVTAGALRDITFSVHECEVVGITGVIGAGGNDIARLLFGLSKCQTGQILLDGKPYLATGPGDAIDKGLFMVPEDPSGEGLVPVLSVANNITLVDLPGITRLGILSLGGEKRLARHYVRQLSIATSSVDTPVRNLSGGNQSKVLLAKALQAGARVLVLQEPTQGVDVAAKADIHRIIRDLAAQGKAIVVISTDIRDLLLFVDRILALRGGRIVGDMPAAETGYAEVLDLTVGSVGAEAS